MATTPIIIPLGRRGGTQPLLLERLLLRTQGITTSARPPRDPVDHEIEVVSPPDDDLVEVEVVAAPLHAAPRHGTRLDDSQGQWASRVGGVFEDARVRPALPRRAPRIRFSRVGQAVLVPQVLSRGWKQFNHSCSKLRPHPNGSARLVKGQGIHYTTLDGSDLSHTQRSKYSVPAA